MDFINRICQWSKCCMSEPLHLCNYALFRYFTARARYVLTSLHCATLSLVSGFTQERMKLIDLPLKVRTV